MQNPSSHRFQAANIDITKAVWPSVKAEWECRHPERKAGDVNFIADSMFPVLAGSVVGVPMPKTAWAANLLFSPHLNYMLSEALLKQPALRAVATIMDIFPRTSSAYKKRNPLPFKTFDLMMNHMWQEGTVEWSPVEVQAFYLYTCSTAKPPRAAIAIPAASLGKGYRGQRRCQNGDPVISHPFEKITPGTARTGASLELTTMVRPFLLCDMLNGRALTIYDQDSICGGCSGVGCSPCGFLVEWSCAHDLLPRLDLRRV